MNSHEALIDYARPVAGGKERLCLDLFPAVPNSFGPTHQAMVKHFNMVESNVVPGLMTLQARCDQAAFLAFFGCSWDEAVSRWPTLAFFHDYRERDDRDAYAGVSIWQAFYSLVQVGIEAEGITVAFIEHR